MLLSCFTNTSIENKCNHLYSNQETSHNLHRQEEHYILRCSIMKPISDLPEKQQNTYWQKKKNLDTVPKSCHLGTPIKFKHPVALTNELNSKIREPNVLHLSNCTQVLLFQRQPTQNINNYHNSISLPHFLPISHEPNIRQT